MANLQSRAKDFLNRALWGAMQTGVVTFQKLQADDSFVSYANVPEMHLHEFHGQVQVGDGWLPATEKHWHLQSNGMPAGVSVERGDRIVDAAGTVWLIQEADLIAWANQIRCKTWKNSG